LEPLFFSRTYVGVRYSNTRFAASAQACFDDHRGVRQNSPLKRGVSEGSEADVIGFLVPKHLDRVYSIFHLFGPSLDPSLFQRKCTAETRRDFFLSPRSSFRSSCFGTPTLKLCFKYYACIRQQPKILNVHGHEQQSCWWCVPKGTTPPRLRST
jgi:hypothetical protein